jgi:branched-chain amino acid transport system ATP-binding protein
MAKSALSVENLHAFYGESHILHGVSFDVKEGELITLLVVMVPVAVQP